MARDTLGSLRRNAAAGLPEDHQRRMPETTNVSNSPTIRVQFQNDSAMPGRLASEIDRPGGDYPIRIDKVLAFPGVFRGAPDARATAINDAMKRADDETIAGVIPSGEPHEDYIIPSVFNKAVAEAARETGVARRETKG